MLIKAEQKFIRQSPTKLRLVAQSIRGIKNPTRALFYLESMNKLAATPLAKTLKQAVANAKNNHGINPDTLIIRELSIGEGPVYKRGNPVSRGRFHPVIKKTAHIRIILENVEAKIEIKTATNSLPATTEKVTKEKSVKIINKKKVEMK